MVFIMSVNLFIRKLFKYSKGLLKTEMRWRHHGVTEGTTQEALGWEVGGKLCSLGGPAGGS